tara:strand:+ start:111 stop:368 length:258 start_codon:yes stop_codon:yes gene_type:complete
MTGEQSDHDGHEALDAISNRYNGDANLVGIYTSSLKAEQCRDGDSAMLTLPGCKAEQETTVEDINEFCLLWLCIFDPDVISEHKK